MKLDEMFDAWMKDEKKLGVGKNTPIFHNKSLLHIQVGAVTASLRTGSALPAADGALIGVMQVLALVEQYGVPEDARELLGLPPRSRVPDVFEQAWVHKCEHTWDDSQILGYLVCTRCGEQELLIT